LITGIGVDIVHVHRMKRWQKIPGLPERYFHPDELASAREQGAASALSLAARFAAKEAFGKALGTGLKGIVLKDILVVNRHNGQPVICVSGTALAALKKNGGNKMHLSLTHEKDNSVAMVVLEYQQEKESV